MTTQSNPKIRLLIVVAAISITFGALVAIVAIRDGEKITEQNAALVETTKTPNNWWPGPKHPKVPATDFYDAPFIAASQPREPVQHTPSQVSRETIIFTLILSEGDLLADQVFNTVREFVTEEQLMQAKSIAREYNDDLKDLRRERSRILEQAGIEIEDPEPQLQQLREKAFLLCSEVRQRIMMEVLTAKERKQVMAKAKAIREAKESAAASAKAAAAAKEKEKNKPAS